MNQELVYRMRTCAAAILAARHTGDPWDTSRIANDAADLLAEASNLLDVPEPLGEPMALIQPQATPQKPTQATWGGELPSLVPACPSCGAVSARTVRRENRKLMLVCPKCGSKWEYGK
jgi:hypothetical protein